MGELAFERLVRPKARERVPPGLDGARTRRAEGHSLHEGPTTNARAAPEAGALFDEAAVEEATRAPDAGEPLRPTLRALLERELGRYLGAVRVHTGPAARRATAAAGARALTRGAHIFLASPRHAADPRLLAHEAAHVAQQGAAPPLRFAPPAARAAGSPPVPRAAPGPGAAPGVQREESSVLGTLRRAGGAVADTVRSGASAVVEGVENIAALTRDGMISFARQVAPQLVELFEGNALTRLLRDMIASGVSTLIDRVLVPLRRTLTIDNITSQIGAASTALGAARASMEQRICDGVLGAARRVSAFFSETFGPIVDWFRGIADTVSQKFHEIWDSLGAPVMDWLRRAGGAVWARMQGFIDNVGSLIGRARAALGPAWDTVKRWLGVEAEDGTGEGGGIWNWIRDKVTEVGGAIADAVRPVLGPLRQASGVLLLLVPGGALVSVILLWPEIRQAFDWLVEQWEHLALIPRAREFWAHTLLPRLMGGAERIGLAVVHGLEWLVGLLGRVGTALAGALSSRLTGILEPLNRLVDFFHGWFDDILAWARVRLRAAGQNIRGVLDRLIAFGRTVLDIFLTLISVVLNPFGIAGFLMGTLWRLVPDCLKGPIIEFILDVVIGFIQAMPPSPLLGLLWPFVRAGLLGFLERLRRFGTARLVAVSNQIARIVSGMSPSFFLGFLRGIAIGLWELVAGPFQALASLFELPALVQGFLSNLGVRLCDLVESIRCFAASLAGRAFGRLDDILRVFGDLLRNPARLVELIRCAIEGAMATVARLGAELAVHLMQILEGPEDAIGEMLGRITASVVGNAVISYFTAGVGTAVGVVGRIASALRTVGRALREALQVLRRLLGQLFRFVRALASRFGSAVARGARGMLGRAGDFFGRIGRWFGRLFSRMFNAVRRRFALSPQQRLQWREFLTVLRAQLAGHASGIRRAELRPLYRGIVNNFRGVARWPAFITKHGPHWRLWVRRAKSIVPRVVGRVLLDSRTRLPQGMNEVKRTVNRMKWGAGDLSLARISAALPRIALRYRFTSLTATFESARDDFDIAGSMSPPKHAKARPRRPPENVFHDGPVASQHVSVFPLVKNHAHRSSAHGTPPLWSAVRQIRTDGDASLYVKGHLVSGWWAPGRASNLTPITRTSNTQMELGAEGPVFLLLLAPNRPVYKYEAETSGTAAGRRLRPRKIRGRWTRVGAENQLAHEINIRLTPYHLSASGKWDRPGTVRRYGPFRNVPPFPVGKDE